MGPVHLVNEYSRLEGSSLIKMVAEAVLNGGSSASSQSITPAQRLQEKHAADASRQPTIETAVDEEDIAHPPPSLNTAKPMPGLAPQTAQESISEKAAGKQKVKDEPARSVPQAKAAPSTLLDTKSDESFPALGGGPKPQATAPMAMAWGARKPSSVANAAPNGSNNLDRLSSPSSSRASTPTSGKLTPASPNASIAPQPRGTTAPQYMPMPGRYSERIQFAPSQLLPRDQLKKPLLDVLRGINKRSKATVEMKPGPNGTVVFEGTGPVDAARQALRDVAKEVGSKVRFGIPEMYCC